MKKSFVGFAVILAAVTLVSCASSKPAASAPVKADAAYQLPVGNFQKWYDADLEGGDTISFKGGGVDYMFPAGFDPKAYSSLYLVYETSAWVAEPDVLAQTGKEDTMQLSVKDWDGEGGRVDLTYPYVEKGTGEVALLDGDQYQALTAKGIEGFAIAANVWSHNGIARYKVKIISLEARP